MKVHMFRPNRTALLRLLTFMVLLSMMVGMVPPAPATASTLTQAALPALVEKKTEEVTPALPSAPAAPAAIPATLPFVYFSPFPEEQIKQSFDEIQTNGSEYVSVVYITVAEDNTVIVYDHWEDGYEPNIAQPTQATTRVFGDGNPANGNANDYCANSNCPGDLLTAGDVLVLSAFQTVTIPRNPTIIKFDGRDKFATNLAVGNGRSFWPVDTGPLFAGAEQFLTANDFGTTFVMPLGQDLSALSTQAFERVAAFIMPSQNQTVCTWNGTTLNPLNQGQGLRRANVQTGDTLVCNKPVQVHLITGDVGSNYESRTFAIFGRDTWGNSYYDPVASVSGAYDDAVNYIYNPHGSTLQVRAETRFGTTNINVPAGGVAKYVKPDSAVHLYSSNGKEFYAVNANDAAGTVSSRNQAFDWGHALVPESKLTDQVVSGWAPGSDGLAAPNGSPVWVTALAATTIYADFDQNGSADFSQAVQPLQSIRIYDNSDRDQSGMRVYTTDGTLITAAWGEDRSTANPARPNIDVGTVVLPYKEPGQPILDKSVALLTDVNGNGNYDPGDTARYTIVVGNPSGNSVTNAVLTDALPAGVTLTGSPTLNGGSSAPSTFPAGPLNLPDPAQLPGTLPSGSSYTIVFDVTINAGTEGQTKVNTATLTTDQATLNDDASFNIPDAPTPPVCGVDITARFTDNSGADVSFVLVGGSVYVTVLDTARTHDNGVVESVQAIVRNQDGGDEESITLTETSASSNTFRNTAGLPLSESLGVVAYDGTLNGRPGQDLAVDYTNALWGLTCSDTAVVAGPSQTKLLYLSEPGQGLDRIDPVATGDTTTATSQALSLSGSGIVTTTGLIAFASPGDSPTLPFRTVWNGTSFGSLVKDIGVAGLGNFRILQGAASPNSDEKTFIGVIDSASNNVVAMQWNGTNMNAVSINPLGTASETFWWGGEVEYEQQSGDALMVWNGGSNLKYSIWNGASWTAAANITSCNSGEPKHLRLAADPNSDEMVLVVNHADETDCALVWNGSSWGNTVTLDNDTSQDRTDIYVAYESLSGDALVVYNTNTDQNMNYRIWNGATWSSEATITAATDGSGPSGYARWSVMDSDPTSDRIVLGVQTSDPDGWVAVWNGSSWEASALLTTSTLVLDASTAPNVAVAFESASGQALATYGRSSQNVFFHRTWTSGSGWSSEVVNGTNLGANTNSMTLDADPNSDKIMLSIQDDGSDLNTLLWNGSAWTHLTELTTSTGETKNQPFAFVWSGNQGATGIASTTFTQTLPMQSDFLLTAGGLITVTTYISTTGTLTANPAITATLKSNGTTFSTLPTPTATLVSAGVTTSNVAYKVGNFVKSTSTGNQVITHNLGKTPKAIILWTSGQTVETPTSHYRFAQGFSDGTTSYSFSAASQNGVSTANTSRRFAAKVLAIVEWSEVLNAEADLASWTTSSFTLNWTTNNTTATIIHYMIIGGNDVSAKVINWQMPIVTGNRAVTGVGFQPDLVFHMNAGTGLTGSAPSSAIQSSIGLGAMNANGEQWALTMLAKDAINPSAVSRGQRTDAALVSAGLFGVAPEFAATASYAAMSADGFTVNFSAVSANSAAGQVVSLALRGVTSKLGSFNKRTSVGSQSITGVGFQPEAVMFGLYGSTASTTAKADGRYGVGAADGTAQASAFISDQDAQTPTATFGLSSTAKAIVKTEGGSLRAAADLSSMDSGGFTLNWTTEIESFAAEVLYLALDAPQTTTPSVYKVVWNGVLAGNTTAATGQAVNLTVASGITQPVQVLYDSSTYPSRIALPTNTVIKVDDLAFYDAPYPLGNLVTSGAPGQTLFIRAQVSDPFGYADIMTTTLGINGSQTVLDPTYVVSSTGAIKIYDYPWLVPPASTSACNDTYAISVVANEGYETGAAAISASASTNIAISCNDNGNPCAANFLSGLGGAIVGQYAAGATVFMQVVDYDHMGAGTISVDLSGTGYTLNEVGSSGVFQGGNGTIAGGSTRTLTYSDATALPAGSDVCIVDIAAPDAANPGITVRKTRKIPAGGTALVGGQVVYEIAVTNSGNQSLSTVQVVDTYDAAYLQFETADPAQSLASTGVITWANVGPLASGQSKRIEVSFTASGTISPTINSVTVTGTPSGGGGNVTHSDTAQVVIAGPEVDLTKTTIVPAAHQPVSVGSLVTFRIDVHNVGDLGIDILPMIDYFDTYCLAYVSSTQPPDGIGFGGMLYWGDLTQTFGNNLAVNDHFIIDVTFRLQQVCSVAVNNASVQGAVAEIPPGSGQVTGAGLPVVVDDDYVVGAASYDFGDAPNSYGTTLAANGPQHVVSLFQPLALGSVLPDEDTDGQPGVAANGDDLTGSGPDDEDAFTTLPLLTPGGSSYSLTVPLTNSTGTTATLYAWVDFNVDGLFSATEIATVTVPYAAGSAVLNWSGVAITSTPGITTTYARLRLTSDALTDAIPTAADERALGPASNGEVEDYAVSFSAFATLGDFVWYDTNGNGAQDSGEPGIPGVVISLTNSVGSVVTTTTNGAGIYTFTNLVTGGYTVTVGSGLPVSATATAGAGSKSSPYPINLTTGQVITNADFGYEVTPAYTVSKELITGQPARTREIVQFRITITNTGAGVIDFLPLADTYNEVLLRYVSATTAPDNSASDGTLNWADLTATLGDLAPGQAVSLTVSFEALRDTTGLPSGHAENVATASGVTVDPDGTGPLGSVESLPPLADAATVIIHGPTNVAVINTSVRPLSQIGAGKVAVTWETVSELNVVGFHLYRTEPGGETVKLTDQPILAEKSGQAAGAAYSFVDDQVVVGVGYTYELAWLADDGGQTRYPLGTVVWPHILFLPLVVQ